jgi:hypothetical protein
MFDQKAYHQAIKEAALKRMQASGERTIREKYVPACLPDRLKAKPRNEQEECMGCSSNAYISFFSQANDADLQAWKEEANRRALTYGDTSVDIHIRDTIQQVLEESDIDINHMTLDQHNAICSDATHIAAQVHALLVQNNHVRPSNSQFDLIHLESVIRNCGTKHNILTYSEHVELYKNQCVEYGESFNYTV